MVWEDIEMAMLANGTFTSSQQIGFDTIMSGKNCFVTGDAGTGKSFLLIKVVKALNKQKKRVRIMAPTGLAALNVDGVTLHRGFRAPIGPLIKAPKKIAGVLGDCDVLIIEEVSMVRIDLFEYCIKQVVGANMNRRKIGLPDIQLILFGDFFQLPPVLTPGDRDILKMVYEDIDKGYAFKSKWWDICNFTYISLKEIVRQDDVELQRALEQLRRGNQLGLKYILQNCSDEPIKNAISLCGTRKKADAINAEKYNALKGKEETYISEIDGEVKDSDKPVDDEISLKVGARVLAVMNNPHDGYMNGDMGEIVDLDEDTVTVQFDNGEVAEVEQASWSIKGWNEEKQNIEVIGTYSQIPLKLAYAITIHKSQGQTYDAVNLDPRCWENGQLYTALSRVRDVHNLYLMDTMYPSYLKASRDVRMFYKMNNM